MDITALATPNLIAQDLFITHKMTAAQGYLVYLSYSLGTKKGDVDGDLIQNPFIFGKMSEARANYTGQAFVESVVAGSYTPSWTPVFKKTFRAIKDSAGDIIDAVEARDLDIREGFDHEDESLFAVKFLATDGSFAGVANLDSDGKVTVPSGAAKICYKYDAAHTPAVNMPTVKAHQEGISLIAEPRKLAMEYNIFAQFIASNDYGTDLNSSLSVQAQNEIEYEIDSTAVYMIKAAADKSCTTTNGRLGTWVDEELD